jgi:hypothetical protein
MLLECLGMKYTIISPDVLDTSTMLLGKGLKLNLSFKGRFSIFGFLEMTVDVFAVVIYPDCTCVVAVLGWTSTGEGNITGGTCFHLTSRY